MRTTFSHFKLVTSCDMFSLRMSTSRTNTISTSHRTLSCVYNYTFLIRKTCSFTLALSNIFTQKNINIRLTICTTLSLFLFFSLNGNATTQLASIWYLRTKWFLYISLKKKQLQIFLRVKFTGYFTIGRQKYINR